MKDSFKVPEIIAEIGVNYYDIAKQRGINPLEAAILMVDEAKSAGINIVKFQTYKAEKLAAAYSPSYWDLKEEPTTSQRELFSKFDKLTYKDYHKIAEHSRSNGVEFMSTPFDRKSANEINELVRRHKIASADITNIELLTLIGSFKKPVLLSTGASTKGEIKFALEILAKNGAADITLLHCVLCYPTPVHDANLWRIKGLRAEFHDYKVGYSDHTKYNKEILLTSWILGAQVIEKHFTLDKTIQGNDHYHAADPIDFKNLVETFSDIYAAIGTGNDNWYSPEENRARSNARRGVYLVRDVKGGNEVKDIDVEFLRPLGNGITTIEWANVLANHRSYSKDKKSNEQLLREDIP